jgi:hypothetical protein
LGRGIVQGVTGVVTQPIKGYSRAGDIHTWMHIDRKHVIFVWRMKRYMHSCDATCLCGCVCLWVCVCVCVLVCVVCVTHMHGLTYIYVGRLEDQIMCVFLCVGVSMFVYTLAQRLDSCTQAYRHTYIHTYIHTFIHTYIRTHTHTYRCAGSNQGPWQRFGGRGGQTDGGSGGHGVADHRGHTQYARVYCQTGDVDTRQTAAYVGEGKRRARV